MTRQHVVLDDFPREQAVARTCARCTAQHRPRRNVVRWGRLGFGSCVDRRSHCHAAGQMSFVRNDMGIDELPDISLRLAGRPPMLARLIARHYGKDYMLAENNLDLEIALRKIHELAMEDGDLGYAYWYEVGQLLRRAAGMQAEIDLLKKELERYRAMLARKTR
jgi:hypothetical protein